MRAAVSAGADAVYFGLQGYNARARAANFDVGSLERTMAYLHRHGVRGYVTLNTLIFDDELLQVEAAVRACAAAGVDAVIVQDLGVLALCRAVAPGLVVHASTQMTCTDADAVELVRAAGARRVILARELSLEDIACIRAQTDAELEVFVHGALCIAYSGQCLTSEALGGRSANRGACAQACRLPYELVVDGQRVDVGDRAYLLSPQDLEASALVPRLMELGVASLKIEGRLKGPEYVAATTRLYREAVEGAQAGRAGAAERRAVALQMYSRGSGPGFLGGVDHQRLVEGRGCDHRGRLLGECVGTVGVRGRVMLRVRLADPVGAPLPCGDGILVEGGWAGAGELGGRVWAVEPGAEPGEVLVWLGPDRAVGQGESGLAGRRVWRTSAPGVEAAVRGELEVVARRVGMRVRVSGALGEAPRFEGMAAGVSAVVMGDAPVLAGAGGDVEVVLGQKLRRLGETPFELVGLELDLPAGAMIPPASINRARRGLVEGLLRQIEAPRARAVTGVGAAELLRGAGLPDQEAPPAGLYVLCRTQEQAQSALRAGADGVYLDFLELTGTGAALRGLRAEWPAAVLGVAPPRIRKPGEDKIDRYLMSLRPDVVLVRGLGLLRAVSAAERDPGGPLWVGDFSLNVTNRLSAAAVLRRGLSAFTPAFDLDAAQLTALLGTGLGPYAEVVLHHPMPLFHMEHCVIAALLSSGRDHLSCGRPCERHRVSLRDRAGMEHPVEADVGCRNTVFHAAAQSAAGLLAAAQARGARRFRIELVREGAQETRQILTAYRALLSGTLTPPELRRTLRTAGGYGVVTGSLRVLS